MLRRDNKYEVPIGVLFDVDPKRKKVAGQLNLKRASLFDSNVVHVFSDEFFHIQEHRSLNGISKAGRVSLLDCVRGGSLAQTRWGDFTIHGGNIAFRYAVFGSKHVAADEKCVRGIRFTLEGVESSVFVHDKFERYGHIHDPHQEIIDVINRRKPDYLRGDLKAGRATISYFTGDFDLLPRTVTTLGTIHASRTLDVDIDGRGMKDTPYVAIDFDDKPTTLQAAWEKMRAVRQFFAWMMGYAPAWKNVLVYTSKLDEDGYRRNADGEFEVFGPKEWEGVPESVRDSGSLIDASDYPEHFMEVMKGWLERNSNPRRMSANKRYFGCFRGTHDRFLEDGIVSAANTFDLLPDEDKPPATPLPKDVLEVLHDATTRIGCALDKHHPDRGSVLSGLGRIRANKPLRNIVEHRAKVVLEHFGEDKLQHLIEDVRLAVHCRNYYTHGPSDPSAYDTIDFSNYGVVHFLTETLEFIYGMSELLLCGWDEDTSVADGWHPLGGFVKSYDYHRAILLQGDGS